MAKAGGKSESSWLKDSRKTFGEGNMGLGKKPAGAGSNPDKKPAVFGDSKGGGAGPKSGGKVVMAKGLMQGKK